MKKLYVENEEGIEIEVPTRYEVCQECGGEGKTDHPAFSNGITSDEWNGPDWDEESQQNYLSGAYDVVCSRCDGLRVEVVPYFDKMDKKTMRLWEEKEQAEYDYHLQCEAERKFGC